MIKKSSIFSVLLLSSFFNFRLVKFEIIPYYVLAGFFGKIRLFSILLTCIFLFGLRGLFNADVFYLYFSDFAQIILVLIIIGAPRLSVRSETLIRRVVQFSLLLLVFQFFIPSVNFLDFAMKVSPPEHLAASGRGFTLLAPEPSYAGIFFLGILMEMIFNNERKGYIFLTLFLIISTASIWAVMASLVVMSFLMPYFFILGIIASVLFFGFINSRFMAFYESIVHLPISIQSLYQLESQYGSRRISQTLDVFSGYVPYFDMVYVQSYSFVSQLMVVVGTIPAVLVVFWIVYKQISVFKFYGVYKSTPIFFVLFFLGPVMVPTLYLSLRKRV